MPPKLTRVKDKGVFPAIWWEKGEYHWDRDVTVFTNKLHNDVIRILARMSIMMSHIK